MKFNKWTVGLAAVGAVSLASIAQADEKASSVMTAVSSTTLSGYVDTSMEWNPGTGTHQPGYAFNDGKQDGFNLDAVDIRLSKAMDESEWAAGYMIDIFTGAADTQYTGTPIRQAYVNLRTPVGNGIDWKVGLMDNIIGYESTDAPNDPNFTRSYGYTMLARELTGVTATYKFSELVSATVGVADTLDLTANTRAFPTGNQTGGEGAESYKAYVGSITLTAPNDWGFISGSSLYAGFNNGFNSSAGVAGVTTSNGGATGAPNTALYVGMTLNTPVTGMKLGLSYEYVDTQAQEITTGVAPFVGSIPQVWADDIAGYVSYQATEKLSFHGRAEILWQTKAQGLPANLGGGAYIGPIIGPDKVMSLTGTVQYDLWKNVLSRLELRWDHDLTGGDPAKFYGATPATGGAVRINGVPSSVGSLVNSWVLAANIVYKF